MVTHDDDNGILLHNDLVLLVIGKFRDLCVCHVFQCFMVIMLWNFLHVLNLFDVNFDVNGTCDDDVKVVMDPICFIVLLFIFLFLSYEKTYLIVGFSMNFVIHFFPLKGFSNKDTMKRQTLLLAFP
jgi:hypothetical protein